MRRSDGTALVRSATCSPTAENVVNVTPTLQDAKNQRVFAIDLIDDQILAGRITSKAGSKIVASASQARITRQEHNPVYDGINQIVGDFCTAGLARDVVPYFIQIVASL